jgi:disulfide bond formation protein DsbB
MEGLAAAIALIVILVGVLLAQRLPKRSPEPARKPLNRWIGVGWIVLVLAVIGLWVGIKSASAPQPPPPVQLTCPAGPIWAPLQGLCQQL